MLERPPQPVPRAAEIAAGFRPLYAANGLAAFLMAATGPVAIIFAVATRGGLSEADIASWLFAGFALGGVITIVFSLLYRQPMGFAWTIPGTVLLGPALTHLSYAEITGAYLATGVLMLVLGLTGWVQRAMAAIPTAIVMGMVAGVFLDFGLRIIGAFGEAPWLALAMVLAYLASAALPALGRLLPPVLATLVAGVVGLLVTGGIAPGAHLGQLALPELNAPAFSWQAMVELVVPLAITVIAVHNAQGITILRAVGHRPPVNVITVVCGAGALVFAALGAVSTCFMGPANAIMSASGARERQYLAGLVYGALAILFGVSASAVVTLALALPGPFIAVLGGLAMLPILQSAFTGAFRGRFTLGALVTFLVTVSEITIFNIGAPFWGLILGLAVSWLLEREDFREAGGPADA